MRDARTKRAARKSEATQSQHTMRRLCVTAFIALAVAGASGPTTARRTTPTPADGDVHGTQILPTTTTAKQDGTSASARVPTDDDEETVNGLIQKLQEKIVELRALSSCHVDDDGPESSGTNGGTHVNDPTAPVTKCTPQQCDAQPCQPQPCKPQPCEPQQCDAQPCQPQPCKPQPCEPQLCAAQPCEPQPYASQPCEPQVCVAAAKDEDTETHGWLAWCESCWSWWASWYYTPSLPPPPPPHTPRIRRRRRPPHPQPPSSTTHTHTHTHDAGVA
jgi:hypothetical protein